MAGSAKTEAASGFVTTNGTKFILNGQIWYPAGSNDYFLVFRWALVPQHAITKDIQGWILDLNVSMLLLLQAVDFWLSGMRAPPRPRGGTENLAPKRRVFTPQVHK